MTPPSSYTEDALIERPAIALLAALGWETVNAYHSSTTVRARWAGRPGPRLSSPSAFVRPYSDSTRKPHTKPSAGPETASPH